MQFIVLIYGSGMIVFSLLRILLFIFHFNEIKTIPSRYVLQAFVLGIRFDAVISGYFLAIPLVLFFLFSFFKRRIIFLEKIIFAFIFLIYAVGIFIVCADIPWFNHQQTRLTVASLQWTNTPGMMIKIIFEDIQNYPFLIAYVVLLILLYGTMKEIRNKTLEQQEEKKSITSAIVFYLLACGFMFLGIRGRIAIKSPIRWGTAFVSQHNLTNQLGLNPVYTFMQSWLDQKNRKSNDIHYMDEALAIQTIQNALGISPNEKLYSPVARKVVSSNEPRKLNVVLVIMESMTSRKMGIFGNKDHLTPCLDSISKNAVLFNSVYSDGIHTFNGIYSTLFGMPSLPMVHHMKDLANQQPYEGIARIVSKENYQTVFFTTHDDQFDNMAGFLLPNGFQNIVSERNYPQDKVLSTLGVPDHVMFEDAVTRFNTLHQNGKPFFAAFMTGSDHGPYKIPTDIPFHPLSSDKKKQATEYADWSIGNFLKECSSQNWFDSTIFVFTGDHGAILDDQTDHYLSYHHVPLIMYAPKILKAQIIEKLGGQIDVFPTVMSLLNLSYTNNSFGVNLFKEERKFLPFTYDDELGCISKDCFCIQQKEKTTLFRLWNDERCCDMMGDPQRSDSMITFTKAALQTMQSMIKNRQVH